MRTEARATTLNGVPISRYVVFIILSAGMLWWDLYSKWLVFNTLGYEHRETGPLLVWLWGKTVFRLHTSLNHGALWGMGQGLSMMFAGLSVVAAVAVVYWLFVHRGAKSWWLTVALGFVMAGTLGNLYDRLGLHGCTDESGRVLYAVRDFLYFRLFNFYDWPIFNFADTFLVTGAIMLVIQSFAADTVAKPVPTVTNAQPAGGPTS